MSRYVQTFIGEKKFVQELRYVNYYDIFHNEQNCDFSAFSAFLRHCIC